ncbi:MAG TPA: TetR/AcrR family transcriptional regulator C-terminal domain-containing protein [Ktedonobacterales bacterium]
MPLQRETVARAALALLDEVGFDRLTMRRLAETLGVQNPALYWHFKNKEDLLATMAEMMLAEGFAALMEPGVERAWDVWLANLAHGLRRALLSHRDGARVVAGADLSHSSLMRYDELTLSQLRSAGFGLSDAVTGVKTVIEYTLGATFEEQPAATGGHAGDHQPHEPESQPYPLLTEARSAMGRPESRAMMYERGLQLIIAGMRATLGTDGDP